MFERAVDGIVDAQHIAAFGLGLSSAIAGYFATQLNRFGLDVVTLLMRSCCSPPICKSCARGIW